MLIEVRRDVYTDRSTIGKLYIDGVYTCVTLEDAVRAQKIYGETAIPAGTYPVVFRREGTTHHSYKTRFRAIHNGMLHIQNIPGFEYVLIHCGNTPADTFGCILVGSGRAVSDPDRITGSEIAYRKMYPIVSAALERGDDVKISIG